MSQTDHYIVPVRVYVLIFVLLLVLTVATVFFATIDFGFLNWFVALLIASVKASLVVGFFMGLHWERGFNAVFFIASLLAVALFFAFVFFDFGFRGDIDARERGNFNLNTPVKIISQ